MNGPSDEIRESIYQQLATIPNHDPVSGERVVTPEVEGALAQVLEGILGLVFQDVQQSEVLGRSTPLEESEAQSLLVEVDQWSSLVSYATSWVYAPASPSPRRMAGWGLRSIDYIHKIVNILLAPLSAAAVALGANSYSINVGFPWGISVGLNWPIGPKWNSVEPLTEIAARADAVDAAAPIPGDSGRTDNVARQKQKTLKDNARGKGKIRPR